jgi:photosystem II stability/assembly factor-like uncharacterized protein
MSLINKIWEQSSRAECPSSYLALIKRGRARRPRSDRRGSVGQRWSLLKGIVVFLLLFLPVSTNAQAWSKQRTGSLAWLHSVYFLDNQRGWVVGSRGTLLSTNDGGKTWQAKRSSTEDVVRDIFFVDDQNGWMVVEVNLFQLKTKEDPRAYLMKTNDGGEHWTRVNIKGVDVDARLVRAVFTRGGRGWVFGEAGTIYATRDSGETWTRLQSPTRHLLLGGMFLDDDRGWLVGAGSTIIQTSDGGDTWSKSEVPQISTEPVRFNSTSFVNNRLGWAVGSAGNVYRTINGGRSWQVQNSGITTDLLDVKFLDAVEGWAVGSEGTIIYTNDGGLHWTTERSNTDHPLEKLFFVDRTHGWAVGFGGTVVTFVRPVAPRLSR